MRASSCPDSNTRYEVVKSVRGAFFHEENITCASISTMRRFTVKLSKGSRMALLIPIRFLAQGSFQLGMASMGMASTSKLEDRALSKDIVVDMREKMAPVSRSVSRGLVIPDSAPLDKNASAPSSPVSTTRAYQTVSAGANVAAATDVSQLLERMEMLEQAFSHSAMTPLPQSRCTESYTI
eukprot:2716746-Rhodomonas_salina.1